MIDNVPAYLRNNAKAISCKHEEDGAYSIKFQIIDNEDEDFQISSSYYVPTQLDKKHNEWVEQFKKRHEKILKAGDYMTTKPEGNVMIFGTTNKKANIREVCPYLPDFSFTKIINAISTKNGNQIEVFNSDKHGYNAMIGQTKPSEEVHLRRKSKCGKCSCATYKIFVTVHSTGKNDLLIEQPTLEINADNWTNAFDWITIDLECSNCGKKSRKWFEMETM